MLLTFLMLLYPLCMDIDFMFVTEVDIFRDHFAENLMHRFLSYINYDNLKTLILWSVVCSYFQFRFALFTNDTDSIYLLIYLFTIISLFSRVKPLAFSKFTMSIFYLFIVHLFIYVFLHLFSCICLFVCLFVSQSRFFSSVVLLSLNYLALSHFAAGFILPFDDIKRTT